VDDVTVEIDGFDKPRRLRCDANAVCDWEDATRRSIGEILGQNSLSLGEMRSLFWAFAKWQEPRLTRERVGQLIDDYMAEGNKAQKLADAIIEALNKARIFDLGPKHPTEGKTQEPSPSTSADGSESA